jgi:hypothetical protein
MLNTFTNTWQGQNLFSHPGNSFTGQFSGVFSGNGMGLTGLQPSGIVPGTFNGTFNGTFLGTIGSSTNPALGWLGSSASPASFYGNGTFGTSGGGSTFVGDGSGLTGLPIPTGMAYLAPNQTFTGANAFSNEGNTFTGVFTGAHYPAATVDFIGLATAAQSAGSAASVPVGGIVPGQMSGGTWKGPLTGEQNIGTSSDYSINFYGQYLGTYTDADTDVGIATTGYIYSGGAIYTPSSILIGDASSDPPVTGYLYCYGHIEASGFIYAGYPSYDPSTSGFVGNGSLLTGITGASIAEGIAGAGTADGGGAPTGGVTVQAAAGSPGDTVALTFANGLLVDIAFT